MNRLATTLRPQDETRSGYTHSSSAGADDDSVDAEETDVLRWRRRLASAVSAAMWKFRRNRLAEQSGSSAGRLRHDLVGCDLVSCLRQKLFFRSHNNHPWLHNGRR